MVNFAWSFTHLQIYESHFTKPYHILIKFLPPFKGHLISNEWNQHSKANKMGKLHHESRYACKFPFLKMVKTRRRPLIVISQFVRSVRFCSHSMAWKSATPKLWKTSSPPSFPFWVWLESEKDPQLLETTCDWGAGPQKIVLMLLQVIRHTLQTDSWIWKALLAGCCCCIHSGNSRGTPTWLKWSFFCEFSLQLGKERFMHSLHKWGPQFC